MEGELASFFEKASLVNFFFKGFAIVLCLLYLVYAIVFHKQTQVMLRTLEARTGPLIRLVSLIQLLLSMGLLILAFVII